MKRVLAGLRGEFADEIHDFYFCLSRLFTGFELALSYKFK